MNSFLCLLIVGWLSLGAAGEQPCPPESPSDLVDNLWCVADRSEERWSYEVVERARIEMRAAADNGDLGLDWDMYDTPGMPHVHFHRWESIARLARSLLAQIPGLVVSLRKDLDKLYASRAQAKGCFVWNFGWARPSDKVRQIAAAVAWGKTMEQWAPDLGAQRRDRVLGAIARAVDVYASTETRDPARLTIDMYEALRPVWLVPKEFTVDACRLLGLLAAEPDSPVSFWYLEESHGKVTHALLWVRL